MLLLTLCLTPTICRWGAEVSLGLSARAAIRAANQYIGTVPTYYFVLLRCFTHDVRELAYGLRSKKG
jgi:hypothetical protein